MLQAVANLSFSWLALAGVNQWALAFAITAENFTSAIGTVIFVAYLSALCRNPLHTATQYALLTALAAVGRTYLSSGAGYVAKATGWPLFFVICVVVAVPSLILLAWLQRRGHFAALESEGLKPSWPGLSRRSTSSDSFAIKTWMPGQAGHDGESPLTRYQINASSPRSIW